MCGRFNVDADPLSRLLLELVRLRHPGPDNPNAAPTETIMVLRLDEDGAPELAPMRWWLTPFWSKDAGTRYAMFNARAESLETSRAFREPFRHRRCVVPVSGFYEWARQAPEGGSGAGSRGRKLPYYIRPQESQLPGMLLAGLWDRWRDPASGEVVDSFAIVTTDAAADLAFVHDRQPAMLDMAGAKRWLDPQAEVPELKRLLGSAVPVPLDVVPVSTHVNNARHKDARCTEPVGAPVAVPARPAPPP